MLKKEDLDFDGACTEKLKSGTVDGQNIETPEQVWPSPWPPKFQCCGGEGSRRERTKKMDRELAKCPCLNIEIGGSGARCRVGMFVEGLNILSIYGPLPGLAAFFFVQGYVLLQSVRPIRLCMRCCKTAALSVACGARPPHCSHLVGTCSQLVGTCSHLVGTFRVCATRVAATS